MDKSPAPEPYVAHDLLESGRLFFSMERSVVDPGVRASDPVLLVEDGHIYRAGRAVQHAREADGMAFVELHPDDFFELRPPVALERMRALPGFRLTKNDSSGQSGALEGAARAAMIALIEERAPGFSAWLEPAPRLWLNAGSTHRNEFLRMLPRDHALPWAVPEGAAHGDYLLVWVNGVGFQCIFRAVGKSQPAAEDEYGPSQAQHVLVAVLEHPITMDDLGRDDVLQTWPLFRRDMQAPAQYQKTDFLEDSRHWPALRDVILGKNPAAEPLIEALELAAGHHRLMSRIPGYARDTASGSSDADLLAMKADFRVLASLLTAKAVEPPLAVGLFGEWGSGKSFFIQQVKREVAAIASHAAEARRTQPPEAVFFHQDIVQIEFNAWHYADGDLWASLVDHLFTSLRDELRRKRGDDVKADEEMRTLLTELDTVERVEASAVARSAQLEQEIEKAKGAVEAAKTSLGEEEVKLAQARRQDAWRDVSTKSLSAGVRTALEAKAHEHGLDLVAADVRTLVDFGRRVAGLGARGQVLWHSLRRAGVSPWRIGFLLGTLGTAIAAGPIIAAASAAGWISAQFGTFFATVAQVSVLVGGLVKWTKDRALWVNTRMGSVESFLDTVQKAAAEVEEKVRENERTQTEDMAKAEAEIARLKVELETAQRTRAEAERQQIQLLAQIQERLPEKRLADFIEERANSKDYREKLGVMALVRRDFERLSDLLSLGRRAGPELDEARARLRRKSAAPLPAIDRIVLYIDDLDRCTERKVVDVLRAVHLLLAYELFIVVVAVDAKWVSHSLEVAHRDVIAENREPHAGNGQSPAPRDSRKTAADYLEKIFQVPFWLPSFSDRASRRLVHGLLRSQVEPDESGENGERELAQLVAGELRRPDESHAPRAPVAYREPPAKIELAPDSLRLTRAELAVLIKVAPLAGDTPRQAKRFTNLYRLVKVGLTKSELAAFVGRPDTPPTFPAAAVLLALVTGTPRATAEIFDALRRVPQESPLRAFAQALDARHGGYVRRPGAVDPRGGAVFLCPGTHVQLIPAIPCE